MVIAIIGGGASGMAAAIAASECSQNEVHLFERQARVGKKLLATGNGRCNLSNTQISPEHYHGECPEFAAAALKIYDFQNTMEFFHSLGLYTVTEPSGKVYPWSDQAGSVVDVLRFSLQRSNIHVHLGFEVSRIRREKSGFRLDSREDSFICDRLIIACGGLAGTALGGSMSGYQLLRSMGHHCTKLRPALVQIRSSYPRCASLKGIRAVCEITVTKDGSEIITNSGEVQFTNLGVSGPAIFEISRHVCIGGGTWVCHLDVLPRLTKDQILELLLSRKEHCPDLEAGDLLTGIIHNRLGRTLVQEAEIPLGNHLSQVSDGRIRALAAQCKDFSLTLTEPMGMDSAQVTAGGILTEEFDSKTMESRLVPGLYACGEVLDIDGDCGGFNLQWAWSSGRLAGISAGRYAL